MTYIIDIVYVTVQAILVIFSLTGVGALMAWKGHLSSDVLKHIGKITYYVFIPAMAFYKISSGVKLNQIPDAWPMLVYPSILVLTGWGIGAIFNKLVGTPTKSMRHILCITLMFGNFGNIPLPLVETITSSIEPFSSDPKAAQRGLAYASIFLSMASLWLWSFGMWFIKTGSERDDSEESPISSNDMSACSDSRNSSSTELTELNLDQQKTFSIKFNESNNTMDQKSTIQQDIQSKNGQNNSDLPNDTKTTTSNGDHVLVELNINGEDEFEDEKSSDPSSFQSISGIDNRPIGVTLSFWSLNFKGKLKYLLGKLSLLCSHKYVKFVLNFMTPSTWACILAIILLAIKPIHKLMFKEDLSTVSPTSSIVVNGTLSYGLNNAMLNSTDPISPPTVLSAMDKLPPLEWLSDSISNLGAPTIPVSLMMLGANLFSTVTSQYRRTKDKKKVLDEAYAFQMLDQEEGGRRDKFDNTTTIRKPTSFSTFLSSLPLSLPILLGIVAVRLILLPAVLLLITWVFSLLPFFPTDPIVVLVLFIECSTPSAVNLIVLAQLMGDDRVIEILSTVLLLQYLFCTFSMFGTIAIGIKLFI